jgi:site-specific DNA recombinase
MNDPETKNGVIYVRVSSSEQIDGTSLESQERMCREYAKRENITVSQVFIEKGESAKTADRTEFIKAINFCSIKKNNVSYFIVYKVDRFARLQTDHHAVHHTLKKYGTALRSVTEPISDTPMGKMMEGILSTFAEFDNNVRTERSVNGMKERIKQGIWVWQSPLGYYRSEKGGNLAPDPAFAPYIRLAFEEYAKGTHTYESLARYLNDHGFMSKQGNQATFQLVEKIIKNPLYAGIIRVWDMEYKGAFEAIVSEDLFYICQGKKQGKREKPYLANNPDFPLRKIVVCQFCRQPLTGSHSTGSMGKKYPYYHHHKQKCSHAKFIPKESLEQIFVEYLQEITPSVQYEKLFKEIILDIWKNNHKKFDEQNERVRNELKTLELQRQRIFELHQSGTYTDQEFLVQKDIVSKKIAGKKTLIHDKAVEEFNMEQALEYFFGYIRNTAERWIAYEKKPEKRLRFQKIIFEENIDFSGEKFGTAKLTPVYSLYQQYLLDPSSLVTLRGIEPRFHP